MSTKSYDTELKQHIREALDLGYVSIIMIIDYIENKYGVRYSYETVLKEIYS